MGTSLAIQWLRLRSPNAGDQVPFPETENSIPHAATEKVPRAVMKIKEPTCCN